MKIHISIQSCLSGPLVWHIFFQLYYLPSKQSVHSRQCRSLRGAHRGRALLALPFVPAMTQTARQLMFRWIGGCDYFDWAFIAIVTQWGLTGGPGEPAGPFSPCRNAHSRVNCTAQTRTFKKIFFLFLIRGWIMTKWIFFFFFVTKLHEIIQLTNILKCTIHVLKHRQKLGILNAKRVIFHKYILYWKTETSL